MDEIRFQILEDGTIKFKTDRVSKANHVSADELLREVEDLAGGERVTKKRKQRKIHVHDHNHVHEHYQKERVVR